MNTDIVVVGAGPVGLMLAAELRLAGATPLVLERSSEPTREPRARGVGPLAAEALRRRGLGERLAEHHAAGMAAFKRDHGSEKAHFAWIHKIDLATQEEPDRRGALIWQRDLERILGEYVADLGVTVLREHTLTGLVQDDSGVTATVSTPGGETRFSSAYLVGCDGGRSTVRGMAGFDFAGTDPTMICRRATGDITGLEQLPPPGRARNGALFYGKGTVGVFEFDDIPEERLGPVTPEEIEAAVRRVSGVDVTVADVGETLRFTDHARQVTTYRTGRVLLAGDAAHVHSPNGGQGLNLGITDAVNLGWKLAATVRGDAPGALLDTYTTERHPVGAAVLDNTRAQSALLRPGPHTDALRGIVSDLMDIPEVNRYFGRMMSGLGTRYPFPYATEHTHPLAGRHCPDLAITRTEGAATTLSRLAVTGRALLLCPTDGTARIAERWRDRIDLVHVASIDHPDLTAALIRPDGIVAWAAPRSDDTTGLEDALRTWFGDS
jgi:2-polyprenyl-6-methoxyphenol hydroxylase-like FAD-dependent oxidoreductase